MNHTPALITLNITTGQRDDNAHPEVAVSYVRADLAQWPTPRPMESAPKGDGRYNRKPILAWWPAYGGSWLITTWDDNRFAKKPKPFWTSWGYDDIRSQRAMQPTHWMDAPPPPGEGSTT